MKKKQKVKQILLLIINLNRSAPAPGLSSVLSILNRGGFTAFLSMICVAPCFAFKKVLPPALKPPVVLAARPLIMRCAPGAPCPLEPGPPIVLPPALIVRGLDDTPPFEESGLPMPLTIACAAGRAVEEEDPPTVAELAGRWGAAAADIVAVDVVVVIALCGWFCKSFNIFIYLFFK